MEEWSTYFLKELVYKLSGLESCSSMMNLWFCNEMGVQYYVVLLQSWEFSDKDLLTENERFCVFFQEQ